MPKAFWIIKETGLVDYGLQDLESILSPSDQREWLQKEKHLSKLGSGSARFVYDLKDGNALKIAYGLDGIEQNKAEVEVYKEFGNRGFFPKILGYDPNYSWIIMEKARVWESEDAFYAETGLPDDFLDNFCNAAVNVPATNAGYAAIYRQMSKQPELKAVFNTVTPLGKKILKMLLVLTSSYKIDDIGRFDHIGVLSNGNVVVVDYGLSFGN